MRRGLIVSTAVFISVFAGLCVWKTHPEAPVLRGAKRSTLNPSIRLLPNVQVSSQFNQYDFEFCDVAGDPHDISRLFASVLRWREGDLDVVGFYSHDGGVTWTTGCERLAEQGKRLSDTSLAFGPDGTLYLTHMRNDPKNPQSPGTPGGGTVEFACSRNGGKTWNEVARLTNNVDRPWICVDTTGGNNRGRLYCVGNVDEPIVYASVDSATTLSGPVFPRAGRKFANCRHSEPVVAADGSVMVVAIGTGRPAESTPTLYCYRSTDGGRTFEERCPVNTVWRHERLWSSRGVETFWPRLAADTNSHPFQGRIYCVWGDGTNDGVDGERILFSSTSDYGNTWSVPVVISEQPMDADGVSSEYMSFKPSIAVSSAGVVAVSWYDRRGMPAPVLVPTLTKDVYQKKADGWNVRLRMSLDGGASWVPSVQINEEPGAGPAEVGHAAGLTAAADGSFHPVWIDNRTGKRQLWTTRIEIDQP